MICGKLEHPQYTDFDLSRRVAVTSSTHFPSNLFNTCGDQNRKKNKESLMRKNQLPVHREIFMYMLYLIVFSNIVSFMQMELSDVLVGEIFHV